MGKILKTIATSAGFSLFFYCLGCGSNLTQQTTAEQPLATPSITQVLPQTIPAGSQALTLKVSGTNFPAQAAILWNGAALSTTVVDSNTLSGTIGSSSLTSPGTAQLQVQNTQTMQASPAVPVTIAPPSTSSPSPLTVSTTALPQGVVSAAYTATLNATGGASPYTWSVTTGKLPAGLNLAASSGIISGTPTASGSFSFGVTVTDASSSAQSANATVTLLIAAAPATPTPLTIISSTLPSATISSGYSNFLQASGGTAPYTWSIASGSLPAGLSLAPTTGVISGTPTAIGTATFTAAVADSANPSQTKSVSLSLVVAPTSLAITTSTVPSGTIGTAYTTLLQGSGGAAPYSWSVTAGSLPAGLTLAHTTGIISGTPTASGTASFTATLTDAGSPAQTKSVTLSLVIAPITLTITSSALPSGTQGTSYSRALQATGGAAPYTWSISSGTLPTGLSLAPTTGAISGTPSVSGNFSFGVTVKDAGSPAQTATGSVTLSLVATGAPLTISSTTLPAGQPNQTYSATLNATGGTGPYTWSVTNGSLPSGLSLATATGIISGKPTANSTTNLTFQVVDSSSPAQTKSVALSLVIAPIPLAITTSTLPSGTNGASYSNLLQATGGTTPYTWSAVGSLPAGLTLASTTGLISGTPTATGTSNFTASITDAGSPAQTKSVSLSIVVAPPAPPALVINATLPSGTAGTAYSSPMSASGGTPAYTWSITAGTLPSGLTLAATTGIISGTPAASGTYTFTAAVSDNGNPVQTKSAATSIFVAGATAPIGPGTTWYIRPDGGTRYSANVPNGQCDGKADVAYSGTGTNQHCAFNDYRFLYDDQSYNPIAWVISGGDTVIVRGGPWRIGFDQGATPSDKWCEDGTGPQTCENPTIPAGTAGQHTRILGENYGSCGATNKTQLFGGFGLYHVLGLGGAQFVDVECLELTRHSQCIQHGNPTLPSGCSSGFPFDDYAIDGVTTDPNTHDVLMQDMWIHGFPDRGVIGAIGGIVTCLRCDIAYNGMAGWDFDDGTETPSINNATWNFLYSTIEFSGCNQEYPAVDTFAATSCYSQSTGGYGDGVGTPPGTALNINVDHSMSRYNTQDGMDFGHIDTGTSTLSITNSIFYGSNGGQFKWGYNFTSAVVTNNLVDGNCNRMSVALPGAPSSYNVNLTDFCRAGSTMSWNFRDGATLFFANNTITGYSPSTFVIGCSTAGGCPNVVTTFKNNIILGYDNPAMYNMGGSAGGPSGFYCQDNTNGPDQVNCATWMGTWNRTNNIWYGMNPGHFTCPTGYTAEYCENPLLVNQPIWTSEQSLDNFNFDITAGSPAIGAGAFLSTVPLDYTGATRANPPSIGAYEK